MSEPLHELIVREEADKVVARLTGDIDQSNATTILEDLRRLALDKPLVVDLTETNYFDSAGLAMLEMLRHSTDLRLVTAPGSISSRVLSISGMDQVIPTDGRQR